MLKIAIVRKTNVLSVYFVVVFIVIKLHQATKWSLVISPTGLSTDRAMVILLWTTLIHTCAQTSFMPLPLLIPIH